MLGALGAACSLSDVAGRLEVVDAEGGPSADGGTAVSSAEASTDGPGRADAEAPVPSADAGEDATSPPPRTHHELAVYWGQDEWLMGHPGQMAGAEKPLDEVCAENPAFDTIVLSYVTNFVHTRNPSGAPEMNFAHHCTQLFDADERYYLKCDAIQAGIDACHRLGKKVLIAIGGPSGGYGFGSDRDAETFALTMWNTFLDGTPASGKRPFGAARLDGVDLSITWGSPIGYAAFVRRLRELMATNPARAFTVTASPRCSFPSFQLGPGPGTALDAPERFDRIFVQFQDLGCRATSPTELAASFARWSGVARDGGTKVLVGLRASDSVSVPEGFVTREKLPASLEAVFASPRFGGVSLWDASLDRHSGGADGEPYSVALASLLH